MITACPCGSTDTGVLCYTCSKDPSLTISLLTAQLREASDLMDEASLWVRDKDWLRRSTKWSNSTFGRGGSNATEKK